MHAQADPWQRCVALLSPAYATWAPATRQAFRAWQQAHGPQLDAAWQTNPEALAVLCGQIAFMALTWSERRQLMEATEDVGTPPTDDIDDPAVPMAVLADQLSEHVETPTVDPSTQAGQMVMTVDQALFRITEHAATVLASIDKSWDAALRVLNHNNNGLLCLKEAVQNFAPVTPYSATVQAMTPSGFPMSLTVQHATQAGFLEAMGGLLAFLKENGFQPMQTPAAF